MADEDQTQDGNDPLSGDEDIANAEGQENGRNNVIDVSGVVPGETLVVDIDDKSNLKLGVDMSEVTIEFADVDMILNFENGARVVVAGFGLEAMSLRPPTLEFADQTVTGEQMLQQVGQIIRGGSEVKIGFRTNPDESEEDQLPELVSIEQATDGPNDTPSEVAEEPVIIVQTPTPTFSATPQGPGVDAEGTKDDDFTSRPAPPVDEPLPPVMPSPPASPPGTPETGTSDGLAGPSFAVSIDATLLGVTGVVQEDLGANAIVTGAFAATGADQDGSFAVQQAAEIVNGTIGSDVITADDVDLAPAGKAVRLIEVQLAPQSGPWEPTEVRISGLPPGYTVLDSEDAGNYLSLGDEAFTEGGQSFRFVLQYDLPAPDAPVDEDDFYERFDILFNIGIIDPTTQTIGQTSGALKFAIGDVEAESDVSFTDVITGEPVYVLNATPPGNIVDAGAGDDSIVGGAGVDVIDGGAGEDSVLYSSSNIGVTVDLEAQSGTGGYAEGDTYTSVEHAGGSLLDDQLLGTDSANTLTGLAGDDVLIGRGGADTLKGGEGTDTADYSDSLSGVTISTDGSEGVGGTAQGDWLDSIERIVGSAHDDLITGTDAGEIFEGGDGDDRFAGLGGADRIDGGDGTDQVDYGASEEGVTVDLHEMAQPDGVGVGGDAEGDVLTSIEHLIGSTHDDVLSGTAIAETIEGSDGNDVISGRGGADILDGGEGTDTVSYADADAGVTIDLDAGTGLGSDAEGDQLSGFEGVIGSAHDDTLSGSFIDETFIGGAGADAIDGRGGNDSVSYADSQEAVQISLDGSTGLGGDAEGDQLTSIENLTGSALADTLSGTSAAELFDGGAGDDVIQGGGGADVIQGGEGSDTADYSDSALGVDINLTRDSQTGGDAEGDTLVGVENVLGSDQADVITGDDIDNVLEGRDGDDVFVGGAGGDVIDGGEGADSVDYSESQEGVSIDLEAGTGLGGEAEGDQLVSIENVDGSNQDDTILGSSVDNELDGQLGDDHLEGLGGADILRGGSGTDTASYASSTDGVDVSLQRGTGLGGDAEGDQLEGIENLTGSDAGDTLTGDDGINELRGGAGDDTLIGLGASDIIDGGEGFDTTDYSDSILGVNVYLNGTFSSGGDAEGDRVTNVERVIGTDQADSFFGTAAVETAIGGVGNDVFALGGGADDIQGGDGFDTADYSLSAIGVTVDLSDGTAMGGDAEGDTLSSIERVVGSQLNDTLTAGIGQTTLEGGDGNDSFFAEDGADTFDGGDGIDTITYGDLNQVLDLNGGVSSGGFADGDRITNVENVYLGGGNDTVYGNGADNQLYGEDGNDLLRGGAGADYLHGGDGVDTADYSTSSGRVRIDLYHNTAFDNDAEGDSFASIENLTGTNFDDVLYGGDGSNTLIGGDGNDDLRGRNGADIIYDGAGDDAVYGGYGADIMYAGDGADYYDGSRGTDTVDYSESTSGVTIDFNTQLGSGGYAEGDRYLRVERFVGSDHADTFYARDGYASNYMSGGDGDDTFHGSNLNDTFYGNSDSDTFFGSAGSDYLAGGNGHDIVDYRDSAQGVNVTLNVNSTAINTGGDAAGDRLMDVEEVRGSAFDDVLTSLGAGHYEGRGGDDTIVGSDHLDYAYYNDVSFDDLVFQRTGLTSLTITDARDGSPLGTDTLEGIEQVWIENNWYGFSELVGNEDPETIFFTNHGLTATHSEDFEGGATGWTDNTTTQHDGILTEFLGRFDGGSNIVNGDSAVRSPVEQVSKTFDLSGDQTHIKLSFDFYQIDSWDWEQFAVYVNGELVSLDSYNHGSDGLSYGNEYGVASVSRANVGFSQWAEQVWTYDLIVDVEGDEVTIGFGASLSGGLSDESWGIDNFSITENVGLDKIEHSIFAGQNVKIATAHGWDAETDKAMTYALVDDAGGRYGIDAATGEISVADPALVQASGAVEHQITVRATDPDGGFIDQSITIEVLAEPNLAPIDIVMADNVIAEDATNGDTVGTVVGSDPNNGELLSYRLLDDANGRFAIDSNTGQLTIIDVTGLDYETTTSYAIIVEVEDTAGQTYSEMVTIQVSDVNEAPDGITATISSIDEDAVDGTVVGSVAGDDPDAGDVFSYALTDNAGGRFAIDPDTGVITLADASKIDFETDSSHTIQVQTTDSGGLTSVDGVTINVNDINEAPTDVTLTNASIDENANAGALVGTAGAVDQDLADSATFTLIDDADGRFAIDLNSGDITLLDPSKIDHETLDTHTVTVQVTDGAGHTFEKDFDITVSDVNEAPTNMALSSNHIGELESNGTVIGTVSTADVDQGDSFTYALTNDADGRFAINPTTGELILADTASVDFEADPSHSITVEVTDAGGLTYAENFTINVLDQNEASTDLMLSASNVNEGSAAETPIGTITVTDPDAGDSFVFSLTDDAGGRFEIDADTGVLEVANPTLFDHEAADSHNVTVRVTDSAGNIYNETFAVAVNDVNEAPESLVLSANQVGEHATGGASIGSVSASDPDDGDSVTYSLIDDADGLFDIDSSTGEITVQAGATFDFETETAHHIEVEVEDVAGLTATRAFTIQVVDQNDTPTAVVLSKDTIEENVANGSTVGVASTVDPDASDNFTYELTNDADGRFEIDKFSGEITVADTTKIDFETATSHLIEVETTDSSGATFTQNHTINVTDTNDAPTDIALTAATIAENAALGTVIGTTTVTDPDGVDSFTYALTDNANGRFAIDADSGQVTLADPSLLDFETASDHQITVQVTDSEGASTTKALTISVIDGNESPTDLSLVGNTANETAASGTAVGTVSATDPDAGDSFTYALTDDADGRFEIDENTGQITIADASKVDFEDTDSHEITVEVSDAGGLTYSESFTITVTEGNDAPTSMALSTDTVEENAVAGTVVGTVATTDPDAVDSFTYVLTDDAGGRFDIDANTGQITVADGAVLDYEASDSHNITIRVTDSANNTYDQTFAITVQDQSDESFVATADVESFANTAGIDTVSYENSDAGVTIVTDGSVSSGGFAAGDTLDGVDAVVGSSHNDDITAGSGTTTLSGGAGDDVLTGNTDAQTIEGGDDADTITGGGGADVLRGDAGNDLFVASEAEIAADLATYDGGEGSDTLRITESVGSQDLNALFNAATNIETIDLTQASVAGSLNVSGSLISQITDGNNALTLLIDGGDSVNISDDPSVYTFDGSTYTFYTDAGQTTEVGTLTVVSSNQAPTDMALSANTVSEAATIGAVVGTVTTTDADAGDSFTYALTNSASGRFAIDADTGVITVADADLIDFETQDNHEVTVRVTDAGGLTHDETFTINITDQVNESFRATADAETFNDTAGIDSVSYEDSTAAVTIANDGTVGSGGFAAGDVINGVDELTGSDFADFITGGSGDETINGGAGDDTIDGGGGDDTLNGDAGDDVFIMSEDDIELGQMFADGGADNDTVRVTNSAGTQDIASLFNIVSNIEVIDYTQASVAAGIDLSAQNIRDVTDDDNQLTLMMDGDDTLNLTDDPSTYAVTNGGNTITFFSDAGQTEQIAELTLVNS